MNAVTLLEPQPPSLDGEDTRTAPFAEPSAASSEASAGKRSASPLFRTEALERVNGRSAFGPVLALTPVSLQRFAAVVGLLVVSLLTFAALAPIPRFETVEGRLAAGGGMVTLRGPGEGVVSELRVEMGQRVAVGETLLAVRMTGSGDVALGARRLAHDNLAEELRLQSLIAERTRELAARQIARLGERRASAVRRIALLERRLVLLEETAATQQARVERFETLHAQGHVSASELEETRIAAQQARDATLVLHEQRLVATDEANAMEREIIERGRRRALDETLARRERLAIEARMDELDTPEIALLASPVDGIVSAVNRREGQSVAGGDELVRVMPAGGELFASFLVPSRAVGLIEPGQAVKLRFDAFPHERYGSQRGTLRSLTPTAVTDGRGGAADGRDALPFLLEVALERETVHAKGLERRLLPDMGVSGSIELERRTLLQWVLAPLGALRHRLAPT